MRAASGRSAVHCGDHPHNGGEAGQWVPDVDPRVVGESGFPRGVKWQVFVLLLAEASWW
jgi:hypothetical protein